MQAMQEAMKRPELQQQVQEMTAAMQDRETQEKLSKLKVCHLGSCALTCCIYTLGYRVMQ